MPDSDWLAVGDSIGTGYSRFAGVPGQWSLDSTDLDADAAAGRTPQQVLDYIKSRDSDYFKNKSVILSGGVSNDPSQIGLVSDQIKALQDAGVGRIQLVGVGNRAGTEAGQYFDLRQYNPQLANIAQKAGVGFTGPLPAIVHPPSSFYKPSFGGFGTGAQAPVLPPVSAPPMPAALTPSPATGNDLGLRPAPALGSHVSATSMAVSDPEHALDLIEQYESGGKNIPNYRFDPGHTAQGHFQITNSTWKSIAPAVGIDLAKYPNAMSAPYDVQRAAARELLAQQGFSPWAPYNPRLAAAIGWGGGGEATSNALAPTAANTGPTAPAPDRTSLGNASLAGAMSPLGGPWARLLGLSLLGQTARPVLPQVKYDPSLAMTEIPPVRLAALASPLGDLGGMTTQVPRTSFAAALPETPRVAVNPPNIGLPRQATYVTRIGMRDFWNE